MPEGKEKPTSGERDAATSESVPESDLETAPEIGQEAEERDAQERDDGDPAVTEPETGVQARLEAETASLRDQLLRTLAEMENLRRRTQRERADAVKYAAAPLIKDLAGVADNLRRAMESTPAIAVEENEQLKTLMAGLEMTEKELLSVFEKHGIVKIEPLGETMDPHFHEAMYEVPDPSQASGTVVQVIQAGYRLHDRLLRPAQVAVAKGGPAAAQANGAQDAQPEDIQSEDAQSGDAQPGGTVDTTA